MALIAVYGGSCLPLLFSRWKRGRWFSLISPTPCCFVVYSTRRFVLGLTLYYFVLVFFSVLLALRLPRLWKRELFLGLFVCLFDLRLFGFVCFLFLLVSGKGCGLWLWHSLDFSFTFLQHILLSDVVCILFLLVSLVGCSVIVTFVLFLWHIWNCVVLFLWFYCLLSVIKAELLLPWIPAKWWLS